MANTTAVYARIDSNLKKKAEGILSKLGISPSSAIQMLYSQIVLVKGMPFQSKLPETTLFSAKDMSRTDFDQALQKGIDSIEAGKTHSVQEVDEVLAQEFGI